MKTIKIPIWLVVIIIIIFSMSFLISYSTYGAPSEFGNETTTTVLIGGDDGIGNFTGPVIAPNLYSKNDFLVNNEGWITANRTVNGGNVTITIVI